MGMTARPDQPIVVAGPLAWHALEVGFSLTNVAAMIINMTILVVKSGGQQTGQMAGQGRGKATAPPLQVIKLKLQSWVARAAAQACQHVVAHEILPGAGPLACIAW